ncbi:MAG TPA: hypothetical protein VGK19_17660 [Capsulimonadaceae bacterium]|jgi:hypothetical protein
MTTPWKGEGESERIRTVPRGVGAELVSALGSAAARGVTVRAAWRPHDATQPHGVAMGYAKDAPPGLRTVTIAPRVTVRSFSRLGREDIPTSGEGIFVV